MERVTQEKSGMLAEKDGRWPKNWSKEAGRPLGYERSLLQRKGDIA